MARQRRSLDEHLADMATRGRNERSTTFSTPAMAPLGPSLIADDAILTEHLSKGAVTLEALDDGLKETLAGSEAAIADSAARLKAEAARIDALFQEVENGGGGLSEEEVEAVVIREAVLKKIAAGTAGFQSADIGNLTVTETANLADAVARRIAANTGQFIELTTDQLVAGTATIDQGVVNKLYADVVQSRELVADRVKAGAVDGQRIIGASIETSDKPNDGVKLSNAGLVAHGRTTRTEVTYPGVPAAAVTYNNRARLTQIKNQYAGIGEPDDVWPGLWFEAERQDGLGQPVPKWKAGVTVTDPGALGVEIKSSRQGDDSGNSSLRVTPGRVDLAAKDATGGTDVNLMSGSLALSTFGPDGPVTARLGMGLGGVTVGHGRAEIRRIPLGILDHWVASGAITISKNTPILTRTVTVPPFSNCEMRVTLRGYPSHSAQYLQLYATGDGVTFGENTHHSPGAGFGTDCRVSFTFKHTGATEKAVTFKLTGNVAIPASGSTYNLPVPATPTPVAEIYFVDLGDF